MKIKIVYKEPSKAAHSVDLVQIEARSSMEKIMQSRPQILK